ncbi:hypothetical protein [Rhodomicrobium lacus]|uniref:hypothetical protein n=1 Tax=Rhodomicrobium lacus TaxID=2498452 RepID=UPI000F8E1119|nr:hypothetical protein [Rhodomicrobium lacus]
MTRASDDLQKALSSLNAAAYAELGAQADAAGRAINDLADAVGADIANASESAPSSFASALELTRVAIELDLHGNPFYLASKKLDAVRAFLPASGDTPAASAPVLEATEAVPSEKVREEGVEEDVSASAENDPAEAGAVESAPESQPEAASDDAESSAAPVARVPADDVAVASWQPLPEGPSFDALSAASKARVEDVAKSYGIQTVHHHEAPAHLHENVAAAHSESVIDEADAPSMPDSAPAEPVIGGPVEATERPAASESEGSSDEASAPAPALDTSATEPRAVSFDDLAGEATARVEEVAKSYGVETVHHHDAPAHLRENVAAAEEAKPVLDDSATEPRGVSFDDLAAEAKGRVDDVAAAHGIETVQNQDAPAYLHDNVAITQDNEPQGEAPAPAAESDAAPVDGTAADPSIEGVLQGGGGDALGEVHARVEDIAERLESTSSEEATEPQASPVEPAETTAAAVAEEAEPAAVEVAPEIAPAERAESALSEVAEPAPVDVISARDVVEATHDLGSPADVTSGPIQEYGAHETPVEAQPVPVFEATQPSEEAAPAQPQEAAPYQPEAVAEAQPVPVYEAAQPQEPAPAQPDEPAPAKPAERQKPQEQKTFFSLWLDMVFGKKK